MTNEQELEQQLQKLNTEIQDIMEIVKRIEESAVRINEGLETGQGREKGTK
jgi:hypothetical protein